jgi:hypothetical protein
MKLCRRKCSARRVGHALQGCRSGDQIGPNDFRIRARLLGFYTNIKIGLKAAARLQYGCTWINQHFALANEMPHGGMKSSGYGKDLSMHGLEDYTVARHVMANFG